MKIMPPKEAPDFYFVTPNGDKKMPETLALPSLPPCPSTVAEQHTKAFKATRTVCIVSEKHGSCPLSPQTSSIPERFRKAQETYKRTLKSESCAPILRDLLADPDIGYIYIIKCKAFQVYLVDDTGYCDEWLESDTKLRECERLFRRSYTLYGSQTPDLHTAFKCLGNKLDFLSRGLDDWRHFSGAPLSPLYDEEAWENEDSDKNWIGSNFRICRINMDEADEADYDQTDIGPPNEALDEKFWQEIRAVERELKEWGNFKIGSGVHLEDVEQRRQQCQDRISALCRQFFEELEAEKSAENADATSASAIAAHKARRDEEVLSTASEAPGIDYANGEIPADATWADLDYHRREGESDEHMECQDAVPDTSEKSPDPASPGGLSCDEPSYEGSEVTYRDERLQDPALPSIEDAFPALVASNSLGATSVVSGSQDDMPGGKSWAKTAALSIPPTEPVTFFIGAEKPSTPPALPSQAPTIAQLYKQAYELYEDDKPAFDIINRILADPNLGRIYEIKCKLLQVRTMDDWYKAGKILKECETAYRNYRLLYSTNELMENAFDELARDLVEADDDYWWREPDDDYQRRYQAIREEQQRKEDIERSGYDYDSPEAKRRYQEQLEKEERIKKEIEGVDTGAVDKEMENRYLEAMWWEQQRLYMIETEIEERAREEKDRAKTIYDEQIDKLSRRFVRERAGLEGAATDEADASDGDASDDGSALDAQTSVDEGPAPASSEDDNPSGSVGGSDWELVSLPETTNSSPADT